jgi:small subunit ribosomal protein S1
MVKAVVLDVDPQKERISLGIKQLGGDPFDTVGKLRKGAPVTCEVLAVQDNGLEVKLADTDITTFIKRSDLSRDRSEQRPERYNVGDKIDGLVTQIDKTSRRISVSIKALEISDEKQAVAQFGSSDSGASLGDILGAALKQRKGDNDEDEGGAEAEGEVVAEVEAGVEAEAEAEAEAEPKAEAEAEAENEAAANVEAAEAAADEEKKPDADAS